MMTGIIVWAATHGSVRRTGFGALTVIRKHGNPEEYKMSIYGGRRKTRANAVISRNLAKAQAGGRKSRAEVMFNEYQTERNMGLQWDKTIKTKDPLTGVAWDLQYDFLRPDDKDGFDLDIEIDGEKFHKKIRGGLGGSLSPAGGKEDWKDTLKNHAGIKVIHVPAVMALQRRWWRTLDEEIPKAILSSKSAIYLDEYA